MPFCFNSRKKVAETSKFYGNVPCGTGKVIGVAVSCYKVTSLGHEITPSLDTKWLLARDGKIMDIPVSSNLVGYHSGT